MSPARGPPVATLEKYGHLQRQVELTRSRTSFAERLIPRTRKKLTPAEKVARKDNHDQHRADLNIALGKVIEVIWQQAEALHKVFPQHDTDYYFQQIIQNAHSTTSSRKVSLWNTFIFGHKEDGELEGAFILLQFLLSSDDWNSGAWRGQ